MNNIRNLFKRKPWILALLIGLLALALRTTGALEVAWRPDEIVYIDWIGIWFSEHFWDYLFQFYHKIYSPQSPVFGNPPLAMWIMTIGIWLANNFHFPALFGGRIINALLGSFTAFYLYNFGRRWFNSRFGLFLGLAYSLVLILVVNNSTAQLETLLTLFLIIALDLTFRFAASQKNKYLYWLGIVLGLSFLTKFTAIPLIILNIIILPFLAKNKKIFWRPYGYFMLIFFLTPFILWAGLRDPNHISALYWNYQNKLYLPFPITYPVPSEYYYFLMIFGSLPLILFLGLLIGLLYLLIAIITKRFQQYQKPLIILIFIIVYLVYNSFFAKYSGVRQLVPIIPLILIICFFGFDLVYQKIVNPYLKIGYILIIFILLTLPLTSFKPQFWSLYTNELIGTDRAFSLYNAGAGGEGMPEVGQYLNQNTPSNSRIAVLGYDWVLKKYIKDRSITPLFLEDGINGAISRGAEYIVVPRAFMIDKSSKTTSELEKFEPMYTFSEKGIVLAKVYSLANIKIAALQPIDVGSKENWILRKQNNQADLEVKDNQLIINYNYDKNLAEFEGETSWVFAKRQIKLNLPSDNLRNTGLYFEAEGQGEPKNVSIVFIGEDKTIINTELLIDWQGFKKIYIPLSEFKFSVNYPDEKLPNFNQLYVMGINITFDKPERGKVVFRNFGFASFNH